jgi:DNA-binding CsgD family transcriptional regulator
MALDKAIDRFFEAALNPDDWPSALDDIARSLGADGATLVTGNSTRSTVAESLSIRAIVAEYFARGAPLDPREGRVRPTMADGFLDDFRHFAPEEIARDAFYQEFLRPVGFGWHAVACLADGAEEVVLSLKRRTRRGPFERREVEALDRTLPHLRWAAAAARQAWSMALHDQVRMMSRLGQRGILLDRHGRVTRVGGGFLLDDGLTVKAGILCAASAAEQKNLDLLVAIATAPDPPSRLPPPPIALHRPSGKRPLVLRAMPLDGARRSLLAPAVAMLLVTDLDAMPRPAAETLRAAFGLTPKEAALALRLAAGDTVEQAAEALSISLPHARQRLKIIFDKVDAHRQSELIALLQRLAEIDTRG